MRVWIAFVWVAVTLYRFLYEAWSVARVSGVGSFCGVERAIVRTAECFARAVWRDWSMW